MGTPPLIGTRPHGPPHTGQIPGRPAPAARVKPGRRVQHTREAATPQRRTGPGHKTGRTNPAQPQPHSRVRGSTPCGGESRAGGGLCGPQDERPRRPVNPESPGTGRYCAWKGRPRHGSPRRTRPPGRPLHDRAPTSPGLRGDRATRWRRRGDPLTCTNLTGTSPWESSRARPATTTDPQPATPPTPDPAAPRPPAETALKTGGQLNIQAPASRHRPSPHPTPTPQTGRGRPRPRRP